MIKHAFVRLMSASIRNTAFYMVCLIHLQTTDLSTSLIVENLLGRSYPLAPYELNTLVAVKLAEQSDLLPYVVRKIILQMQIL